MRNPIRRSMAVALTLALSLLLVHGHADAKCARAQENWSLRSGEEVPSKATLFYFTPSWNAKQEAPTVEAGGVALKSQWKQVSKNDGFTTFRLRFDAGNSKSVAVSKDGTTTHYPVVNWSAPQERRVSATAGPREQSKWTCSHTDIVPIKVESKAHAFRVTWFDLRNGVVDFGSGSSIFPRSAANFWRSNGEQSQEHASFELGHPNCFAYNIPADNLNSMMVTVTPLYRDGSEGKVVTVKARKKQATTETPQETEPAVKIVPATPSPLGTPVLPVSGEPGQSFKFDDPQPQRAISLERPAELETRISLRLVVIALVLGTLFGLLIFRGQRRGVSTARLLATGAVVSLTCGALAWAATMMCFPFWLIALGGGLGVIFLAGRYLEVDE